MHVAVEGAEHLAQHHHRDDGAAEPQDLPQPGAGRRPGGLAPASYPPERHRQQDGRGAEHAAEEKGLHGDVPPGPDEERDPQQDPEPLDDEDKVVADVALLHPEQRLHHRSELTREDRGRQQAREQRTGTDLGQPGIHDQRQGPEHEGHDERAAQGEREPFPEHLRAVARIEPDDELRSAEAAEDDAPAHDRGQRAAGAVRVGIEEGRENPGLEQPEERQRGEAGVVVRRCRDPEAQPRQRALRVSRSMISATRTPSAAVVTSGSVPRTAPKKLASWPRKPLSGDEGAGARSRTPWVLSAA